MQALELRIPPAATAVLFAALMGLAARCAPSVDFTFPGRRLLAAGLALAGATLILAAGRKFHASRTTVDPRRPGTAATLVRTGIYRVTRNPMYVGALAALCAWAVCLANPLAFAALPLFVLYMNRFQIIPEERALLARFGAEYEAYRKSVRRWL